MRVKDVARIGNSVSTDQTALEAFCSCSALFAKIFCRRSLDIYILNVMIPSFRTNRSDQGLHCLLFHLHLFW